MRSNVQSLAVLQACMLLCVSASPAPTPRKAYVATPAEITPSPTRNIHEKGAIISDITSAAGDVTSAVANDINTVLSELGSNLPSYVASGVPNFFQGFPTGGAVASSLGLNSAELAALPTNALNVDPYANWTDNGWNVRFHGNIYKQPNTSTQDLNNLANKFLIGTSIDQLPESQQEQARNLTAEIFVVQQGNVQVSPIHIEPGLSQGSSGQAGGGGGTTGSGGTQDITLPYNTTAEGDFDVFVPIQSNGLTAGNQTNQIQRINTYVTNTTLGNATAYLVPPTGLTVVSDIDDILRVTKIYQPEQGLLNSFARPFVPWENMPDIYRNWSYSIPTMHFHYLTTTPEQITRNYMQFIYATYPGGSFDTRPLNFTNADETLSVRLYLLQKIFDSFPNRKFILVGDVSNSDIMKDYPQLAVNYPNQVQCIFLRNTTATDNDSFPYDTSGFKTLNQEKYMFFKHSDDLMGLDIEGGQCYNQSIAQNLTFGYQNLPLGAGKSPTATNGSAGAASSQSGSSGSSSSSSPKKGAASSLGGGSAGAIFASSAAMLAVFWALL